MMLTAGKGRKEQKNLLYMWQPSKANCTMENFDTILREWADGWTPDRLRWRVTQCNEVERGDRVFIVYAGMGNQGVAMVGEVVEKEEKERKLEIELKAMFHPERSPMLTINELKAHLKGVDWNEKKPIKRLTERQAEQLGKIWRAFVANNRDVFKPRAAICEEWYEEQRQESLIDKAIAIAVDAHSADIDLDGNPTILHALTVGMAGKSDNEKIVGFLHDVVEDTDYTMSDIEAEGFDAESMEALRLLTHERNVPYMEYIERICKSGNKTAVNVKINDLKHNLKRGRDGGHLQFAQKHTTALGYIEAWLEGKSKSTKE